MNRYPLFLKALGARVEFKRVLLLSKANTRDRSAIGVDTTVSISDIHHCSALFVIFAVVRLTRGNNQIRKSRN